MIVKSSHPLTSQSFLVAGIFLPRSYGIYRTARQQEKSPRRHLTWNGGVQDCVYVQIYYEHDPVGDRDVDGVDQVNLVVGFSQLGI